MIKILKKRIPMNQYAVLSKDPDLLSILCYASFGVPRNFLNLVRILTSDTEEREHVSVNRNTVLRAIEKNNEYIIEGIQSK